MNLLDLDFGTATSSEYDEDGHLGVSVDLPGGSDDGGPGGSPPAEVLSPFGFLSRPLDPVTDAKTRISQGCGLLQLRDGDQLYVMLLKDPRVVEKLPKLLKGGSINFCADGSYALFDGEDPKKKDAAGSYTLSVGYLDGATKKAHELRLDKRTKGAEQLSLLHGEGHGLELKGKTAKRSARLRSQSGANYLEVNDAGCELGGPAKMKTTLEVGDAAKPVAMADGVVQALQAIVGAASTDKAAMQAALTPFLNSIGSKAIRG